MEIGYRDIEILGNTPGQWYALSYFISTVLFITSNRKKKDNPYRYTLTILLGTGLLGLMYFTNGMKGFLFITVMTFVLLSIYAVYYLNIEGTKKKYAYYMLRSFMLGEFTASLGWQIYYYGVTQFYLEDNSINQILVMVPTIAVVSVFTYFLEKQHSRRNREMEITFQSLLGEAIIVIFIYGFSNLSYVVSGTPFTTIYPSELFIIRTFADLMGVVLLFFYHELLQQVGEAVEEHTLRNMLELQYNQYKVSEESMALVSQKYHDLKHQIKLLKDGISTESSREYLDQMLTDIKQFEAQYKSGNRVLDAMLNAESMKCIAKGIEFTCVADGEALSFMNPMDISALFGNALDNAIESAEQIQDEKERLIYLAVDRQKNFLRIYVENRYSGRVTFRHHLPLTTKNDTNLHGYGVKSMKQIAEKYNGSIRAEAEDGWFKLSVLIPVPS